MISEKVIFVVFYQGRCGKYVLLCYSPRLVWHTIWWHGQLCRWFSMFWFQVSTLSWDFIGDANHQANKRSCELTSRAGKTLQKESALRMKRLSAKKIGIPNAMIRLEVEITNSQCSMSLGLIRWTKWRRVTYGCVDRTKNARNVRSVIPTSNAQEEVLSSVMIVDCVRWRKILNKLSGYIWLCMLKSPYDKICFGCEIIPNTEGDTMRSLPVGS